MLLRRIVISLVGSWSVSGNECKKYFAGGSVNGDSHRRDIVYGEGISLEYGKSAYGELAPRPSRIMLYST